MTEKKAPAADIQAKPKRKRGGQPGNQNSKGGRGNPHPNPPPRNIKHGAYKKVSFDDLTPEEQAIIDGLQMNIENLLTDQIKAYTIREMRIMQALKRYYAAFKEDAESLYTAATTRTEHNREFTSDTDRLLFESIQRKKIENGELLPGKPYTLQTQEKTVIEIIIRLEQELTTVQAHKVKAIYALAKYRAEQAKEGQESSESSIITAWAKAIIKERKA